MKSTFIDVLGAYTSSILLYGNTNDKVVCPDLGIYTTEEYLVKVLKSRGLDHVIFYGDAGTKGAYCLDPESARFFHGENQGLGMLCEEDEAESENSMQVSDSPAVNIANTQECPSQSVSAIFRRNHCSQYRPGGLVPTEATGNQEEQQTNIAPRRVRYAYRGMSFSEFMKKIGPLMLDPESNMCVVFYNLFTTSLGNAVTLKDNILHVWEGLQLRDGHKNLCILMAPETASSQTVLMNQLITLGLAPKFLISGKDGTHHFNPHSCFEFDLPKEDEVKNLLRRLRVVGIKSGLNTKKIAFQYKEINDIANEVIYCSRSSSHMDGISVGASEEYMRQIIDRMEAYILAQQETVVRITPAVIDAIWNVKPRQKDSAVKVLQRPGWEAAKKVIEAAIEKSLTKQKTLEHLLPKEQAERDWAVDRMVMLQKADPALPEIPHFALLGGPGVGKTTIARLIGEILRDRGILKVGAVVEVTKENLVSPYIGGTPRATGACMRRANESVLLIDEFQSLCRKDAGDSEPTGNEVISILNHGMTDPHQRFCLIITGYADEILDGLKNTLDRGFTSRLEDNIIVIDDYPPEVLMQILLDNIEMQHCKVDGALITPTQFKSKAVAPLLCYLDRIYSERDKSFANARTMELLASKVCMQALHSHDGLVTEACFYTDGVTHDNFTPMFLEDTPEEIMGELNELIGLQTVKEQVKHLFNLKKYNEMVSSMGLPTSRPSLHMVMYGNPGTGKTTVARLLGRLYKSIGVLSRGHVICVKREDLVAGYVGQTAIKTKERLEEAEGGILFIDEAYSLTPLGSINDFGRESVETILAYMEDHRDNIMVIVAGYPAEMDTFLDSNPGLASRFTSYINFEDYSCEELMQILALFCKKQKMLMTEGAVATAYDTLSHWKVTRGSRFGNARDVRTIFERSIQQHASRVVEEEKCNLTKEELLTLTEEDFSGIQP